MFFQAIDINDLIDVTGGVLIFLVIILITVVVLTFGLLVGIGAVKGHHTDFGSVFFTGVIYWLLLFIFTWVFGFIGTVIGFIIALFVLQSRHNTTFFGALGAVIIALIIIIITLYVLGYIFGFTFEGLYALFGY